MPNSKHFIHPLALNPLCQNQSHNVLIFDIRPQFTPSKIPHAVCIDPTQLITELQNHDSQKTIVIYCATGLSSPAWAEECRQAGFGHTLSLEGGFALWEQAGLPVEISAVQQTLTANQNQRYARQIQLPEIGTTGQEKLLKSRVLIIGMGGLGCPASQYLTACGVGTLGLVDFDRVELSNLQRQILFSENDVGELKVECAKDSLQKLNSEVKIQTYPVRLNQDNAQEIIQNYDIVLHGTDNFKTRYLVNEVCHRLKIPFVEGAVQGFGGQVAVFDFRGDGPCYQCVFPASPPQDLRLSCSEIGVLGVLPGLIGVLQATEILKLILEFGQILTHKLLIYDGLNASQKTLSLQKNPKCPICGSFV